MNSGTVGESTGRRAPTELSPPQRGLPRGRGDNSERLQVVEGEVAGRRRGGRTGSRRRRGRRGGLRGSLGSLCRGGFGDLREVRVESGHRRVDSGGVAAMALCLVGRFTERAVELVLVAALLHRADFGLALRYRRCRGRFGLVEESHVSNYPPKRLPSGLLAFSSCPRCECFTIACARESIVIDCRIAVPSPSSVARLKPLPPNIPVMIVCALRAPT